MWIMKYKATVDAEIVWDDVQGEALQRLFPALLTVRVKCPGFGMRGGYPSRMEGCRFGGLGRALLQDIIAHLNDTHGWPRTEKDRNAVNQNLPTIMGWLKEEAEKNGWDLTCRLPM